jgi:hypothetical protein
MLLAFTGETHQWLLGFSDEAATVLRRSYKNPADTPMVINELGRKWSQSFRVWQQTFESARYQAAALAFGELAINHRHYMALGFLQESKPDFPPVFERQLEEVVGAAASRIHSDGFKLSQRIWSLETESFEGIKRTVMAGVSEQKSAWELAQDIEQYLGAGQNCPRWTRDRLYTLTKKDIAQGSMAGLLKGPACSPERGVAYNALRLARTEISYASNGATQAIHQRSPWVEAVKVNLSPEHPEPDICDDWANGGNGRGVYPVDEAEYPPFHPHCLCYVTAVQMSDEAFQAKMRGWLNRTEAWPGMDNYAASLNRTRFDVTSLAIVAGLEDTLYKWAIDLPKVGQYEQLRMFEAAFINPYISEAN